MLWQVWSQQEMPVPMPSFDALNNALNKKERKFFPFFFTDAAILTTLVAGAFLFRASVNPVNTVNVPPVQSQTAKAQSDNNSKGSNGAGSSAQNANTALPGLSDIKQSEIPASSSTAGNPKKFNTPAPAVNVSSPSVAATQTDVVSAADNSEAFKVPVLLTGKAFVLSANPGFLTNLNGPVYHLGLRMKSETEKIKVQTPFSITMLAGSGYTRLNYAVNNKYKEYISNRYVNTVEKSEKTINSLFLQARFNYNLNKKGTWFLTGGLALGQRVVQMNYHHEERIIFDDRSAGTVADMFGNYPILADFGAGKMFTYAQKNKFTSLDLPLGLGYKFSYKKFEFSPGVEGIITKTFSYNAGILNTQKMNTVLQWNKNYSAGMQYGYGLNFNTSYSLTNAVKWNVFLQHNRWFTSSLDPAGSLSVKPRFTGLSTGLTWRIYR